MDVSGKRLTIMKNANLQRIHTNKYNTIASILKDIKMLTNRIHTVFECSTLSKMSESFDVQHKSENNLQ